ncbi:MAG: hypothetical protein ORN24_03985 [Burkholderiales bacterium]|nr:hypothetical protein [Burkholderiales bacterium]
MFKTLYVYFAPASDGVLLGILPPVPSTTDVSAGAHCKFSFIYVALGVTWLFLPLGRHFGGTCRNGIYDNMKTAIKPIFPKK